MGENDSHQLNVPDIKTIEFYCWNRNGPCFARLEPDKNGEQGTLWYRTPCCNELIPFEVALSRRVAGIDMMKSGQNYDNKTHAANISLHIQEMSLARENLLSGREAGK